MVTRRGVLVSGGLLLPARGGLAACGAAELAVDGAPGGPPAQAGGNLASLGQRLAAASAGAVRLVPKAGAPVRHGTLRDGSAPLMLAELLGGLPFGMPAASLAAWLNAGEGRALWDLAWRARGWRAFPCGIHTAVMVIRTERPLRTLQDVEGLDLVRASPLVTTAWNGMVARIGLAGSQATEAVAQVMENGAATSREEAPRFRHAIPFAFGRLLELSMPEDIWQALPEPARRAIETACALEIEAEARQLATDPVLPAGMPCVPGDIMMAFGDALGAALRDMLRHASAEERALHLSYTYEAARLPGVVPMT